MASRVNDTSANRITLKGITIPLILAGIIAFSIIASIALYSIQLQRQAEIAKESAEHIRHDLLEESFYVSQLAIQHLKGIERLTELLSDAPVVQDAEYERIRTLLQSARLDASDVVDAFHIIDKDGVLVYSTTTNPDVIKLFGTPFPNHVTYVGTRETMKTFISPLTTGFDNSLRLYVASPIIDRQTGEFKGVVSASIRAETFANSIEKIIDDPSSEGLDDSSLSLIDSTGKIMYIGSDSRDMLLGTNLLSEEFLALIHPGVRESLVAAVKEALSGKSGTYEIDRTKYPDVIATDSNTDGTSDTTDTTTTTSSEAADTTFLSYSPVQVEDQIVMVTFISRSVILQDIIRQNQDLEPSYVFAFLYAILGSMTAFAIAILVINKRLATKVELKTRELQESNIQLQDAAAEITEKARQLREADVKKGEFSAMITHELKTPLVSIIGYGSMLLNGKLGELTPRQKEKLQIMYTNAERLTALIQDILDVQKLELGQMHLNKKEVSAKNIIAESINSLRPQAEAKGIKLVNNLAHDFFVKCDSGRIIQVLNNLVSNAIKFSPNNSKVAIDANLDTEYAIFSVKDHGIGISEDKQRSMFMKFYQVDTSLTRKAGGTGLGLVICKGIVEAHKGKIWFESEEGKGSIFSFSVPLGEKLD